MDWKTAIPKFRKVIDAHVTTAGFSYLGQNRWESQLGHWRGHLAFEIHPRDNGESRLLLVFISIQRKVLLTQEEAKAQGALALNNTTTYAHYSLKHPDTAPYIEYLVTSPQMLLDYSEEALRDFDESWLPWMIKQSEALGERVDGAHRYHEMIMRRPGS